MSISLVIKKVDGSESDHWPIFHAYTFNQIIKPAAEKLALEEVLLMDYLVIDDETHRIKFVEELTILLGWIEESAPEDQRYDLMLRTTQLQSLIRYIDFDRYSLSIG